MVMVVIMTMMVTASISIVMMMMVSLDRGKKRSRSRELIFVSGDLVGGGIAAGKRQIGGWCDSGDNSISAAADTTIAYYVVTLIETATSPWCIPIGRWVK